MSNNSTAVCTRPLSVGIDDFAKIVLGNYYYVDKTLLIKDIIDVAAQITLLLRPRRFGKTLNLSTLYYYFSLHAADKNLFENYAIWQAGEKYRAHYAKYPVIFLSLKEIKYSNWADAYRAIQALMAQVYDPFRYLLDSPALSDAEKGVFDTILHEQGPLSHYTNALAQLCKYLHAHHGQKAVILLDEYDTPVHHAYHHDYTPEILDFMRLFLGSALKTNIHLEFSVITGILKITKESLFSDLNNLNVFTILKHAFAQHFGLLESEVVQMLQDYGIDAKIADVRQWYDGYCFGQQTHLYNPWSIIKYVQAHTEGFKPYWVNTAGTGLIKTALAASEAGLKADLERLLNGQELVIKVEEGITMQDLKSSPEGIWSLLLSSGYLTVHPADRPYPQFELMIPNQEVRQAFENIVESWFQEGMSKNYLADITQYLVRGDIKTFNKVFQTYITQALSYFDVGGQEPESFYHALVLGMLVQLKDRYRIQSNRESGFGRYDVMLIPKDKGQLGIVIEFKKVDRFENEDLAMAVKNALQQIQAKDYAAKLKQQNIQPILGVAIAFQGKEVSMEAINL